VKTYRDIALVIGLVTVAIVWWVGAMVTVEWFAHRIH